MLLKRVERFSMAQPPPSTANPKQRVGVIRSREGQLSSSARSPDPVHRTLLPAPLQAVGCPHPAQLTRSPQPGSCTGMGEGKVVHLASLCS